MEKQGFPPSAPQASFSRPPPGSMPLPGMVPPGGSTGVTSGAQPYTPIMSGDVNSAISSGVTSTAAVINYAVDQINYAAHPQGAPPPTMAAPPHPHPIPNAGPPPSYNETFQPPGPQYPGYPSAGPPQASGYQPPTGYQQPLPVKPGAEPPMPQSAYAGASTSGYAYAGANTSGYAQPVQPPVQNTSSVVYLSTTGRSVPPMPEKVNSWESGLCGCFSNCGLCIMSWFCGCYVMGKNAEAMGQPCILYCIGSLIPIGRCVLQFMMRSMIRDRRGITGSEFDDFCKICWCSVCALTQEAAEVKTMMTQEIQRQ